MWDLTINYSLTHKEGDLMRTRNSWNIYRWNFVGLFVIFYKNSILNIWYIQEYRSLMSSSQYRRISAQFENSNLAMVLAILTYSTLDSKVCGKYNLWTLYTFMGVHDVQGVVQFSALQSALAIYILVYLWVVHNYYLHFNNYTFSERFGYTWI